MYAQGRPRPARPQPRPPQGPAAADRRGRRLLELPPGDAGRTAAEAACETVNSQNPLTIFDTIPRRLSPMAELSNSYGVSEERNAPLRRTGPDRKRTRLNSSH